MQKQPNSIHTNNSTVKREGGRKEIKKKWLKFFQIQSKL